MKVSKEEKALTRRKIIKTAAELIGDKGYEKVSMRAIAQASGIGNATIYKYFPSKEKLLLAYYEVCAEDTALALASIEGFDDYTLQEKLQVLIDTYLGTMLSNREFVSQSFTLIFHSPMFLFGDANPMRSQLLATITQILNSAWEKEEIPPFPFQSVLPDILCEYTFGILYFWIKDESEEFHETTQLIDMSLGLATVLLQSGVINRTTDFLGFMIKSQMFRALNPNNQLMRKFLNFNQGGRW